MNYVIRMIEEHAEFTPVDLEAYGYSGNHSGAVMHRIIRSAILRYCEHHGIATVNEINVWTVERNSFKVRSKREDDRTVLKIECDWHRFEWELGL